MQRFDDGTAVERLFRNSGRSSSDKSGRNDPAPDRKTLMLCGQAERAIAMALAGECGDPVLQDLAVEAVLPAPNAGRLLVLVRPMTSGALPLDLLERLEGAAPLLRRAVAEAIVRKRTPELAFQVAAMPPDDALQSEEMQSDGETPPEELTQHESEVQP